MPRLHQILGARGMGLDMLAAADAGGVVVAADNPGYPQQVQMPSRGPRGLVLGFGPTSINAGVATTFSSQPQLIFRASRLMVLAAVASLFTLTDFRIGRVSQFIAPNGVPAAAFAETAVDSGLRGDTGNVGQTLAVIAQNNAAAALTFSGACFGVAIDG